MTKIRDIRSHPVSSLSVVLLIAVFAVTCLLTVLMSVRAFSGIQADVTADAQSRVLSGYLRARVRSCDESGAVGTETLDGAGEALVLTQYGMDSVIYTWNGSLMEQLWDEEDGAFDPENGETIAKASDLQVDREGSLLTLTVTDGNGGTVQMIYDLQSGEDEE